MFYVVNLISAARMLGACCLLLTEPLSVPFFVIYTLCGISDFADGYLARRYNATSTFGEVLDSVADFVFIAVILVLLVPLFIGIPWIIVWIVSIALVRLAAWLIGYIKFHSFASLHTYANKATGVLVFLFPYCIAVLSIPLVACIVCGAASISALEECVLILRAKHLDRNLTSIFYKP